MISYHSILAMALAAIAVRCVFVVINAIVKELSGEADRTR